jgi:hypothetical protein
MDLILITGLRGKVGLELAKTFKEDGFEVIPLSHDSIYSKYLLPDSSMLAKYNRVFIVHSGQPNAPRSRLQRKRYLFATKSLIEESKSRQIRFVFISSLSAHDGNRSNYSKDKLFLERLTIFNSGVVIKLGLVSGISGSYTFRLQKIQKLLSYLWLDFLISSTPMYYTPVGYLRNVSKLLHKGESWPAVYSIFDYGVQNEMERGILKEFIQNSMGFLLVFFSKVGSGNADAFLSLIDGMKAPE